jgi:hypothetical protein
MKRLSLLAVLLSSMQTLAQVDVVREPDKLVFRKKTMIDFTGVVQDGDRTGPPGTYELAKPKASFANMIKVRANFTPELRNSTDDI